MAPSSAATPSSPRYPPKLATPHGGAGTPAAAEATAPPRPATPGPPRYPPKLATPHGASVTTPAQEEASVTRNSATTRKTRMTVTRTNPAFAHPPEDTA